MSTQNKKIRWVVINGLFLVLLYLAVNDVFIFAPILFIAIIWVSLQSGLYYLIPDHLKKNPDLSHRNGHIDLAYDVVFASILLLHGWYVSAVLWGLHTFVCQQLITEQKVQTHDTTTE